MEINWRNIALFLVAGIMLSLVIVCIACAATNESYAIVYDPVYGKYGPPNNVTPYLYQGDIVYLNTTVDVSGVVPPYEYLAYWDGYDMYDDNATYLIKMPDRKSGYYNFYIDPAIFETRCGKWYKYDLKYEGRGYNLAFVVSGLTWTNYTMRYNNGTIVNVSDANPFAYKEHEQIKKPPLPERHIADYLVARGDAFNISGDVNETMKVWMFGRKNQLLNYASVNGSIDVPTTVLNGFEPGDYTVMVQRLGNKSKDFTVTYDTEHNAIKWFNSDTFTISSETIDGYSPQVVREKFKAIVPDTHDNFTEYNLAFQDPSLEIMSIAEMNMPNDTINVAGERRYFTNMSMLEVIGYTNTAPGTPLWFIVDEDKQTPRTIRSHTTTVTAEGEYGGNMRWFTAYVPLDKYDLPPGSHTITGYTNLSDAKNEAGFYIYDMPPDSYIPPKTIRYVSGRYGAQEFVPTPTPIVEQVKIIETVPVIQTVQVTVTPAAEVVKAQQNDVIGSYIALAAMVIVVLGLLAAGAWYLVSVVKRARVK